MVAAILPSRDSQCEISDRTSLPSCYSESGADMIPKTDLSSLRIAGLKIGDSAEAVYLHLGEPYSISRLIADGKLAPARRHVLYHPSWFTTDLGDGVYNYTGAVPNKAQSCVTRRRSRLNAASRS
jgi:hypothetical protein